MTIRRSTGSRTRRPAAGAARVVALLVIAGAVSSACSGSADSPDTDQRVTLTTQTDPAKGPIDELVWDLPTGEPPSMDYAKATVSASTVLANTCDTLRRINPDQSYGPNIAESFSYSPDHKTLRYSLRKDITFWDGSPLTSDDVVYSLQRNMDASLQPANGIIFENVRAIDADGPYGVVVRFKKPDSLFNDEMGGPAGVIAQKAYIEKAGKSFGTPTGGIMCSGPFKLDRWASGSEILLSANTDYWDNDLVPFAKKVTLKFVTDTGTLVQALKSGTIDGAWQIPAAASPALASGGEGKLYYGEAPLYDDFLANDTPAGNDPDIRKALSLILDREAITEKVYNGAASPAYSILPEPLWDKRAIPTYEATNDSLGLTTEPDLDAAKALVEDNPLADQPITINALAGDQLMSDVLTVWQEQAKQIGLDLQIKVQQSLPYNNSFFSAEDRKGIDFLFNQTYTYVPNPLDYAIYNMNPGAVLTYVNPEGGDEIAANVSAARAEVDDTKRAELIGKALTIAQEQQLVIPLATRYLQTYMNDRVTGAITSWGFFTYPSLALIGASR